MTQYNTLNVKLSNSQSNELKSKIENDTEVTLKLLSNVVGVSNDQNNFLHNFLLSNIQSFVKVFAKNFSANIKLSNYQLSNY